MLFDPKWEAPIETILEPWRQKLLDAAERIRECGLCQGGYTDGQRFCALGAIYGGYPDGDDAAKQAENALYQFRSPETSDGVVHWNDQPGRTAEEVASFLERVAGG